MKRQKVKHLSDDEKRMIIQEYLEAGDYSQQSINLRPNSVIRIYVRTDILNRM